MIDYGRKSWIGLSRQVDQHGFEDRCRGVNHHVVCFQQSQEVLDFLALEVKLAGLITIQREPQLLAGILAVTGQEIQKHHVDVLDFVVAGLDRLFGRHVSGNVPADPHAAALGPLGDGSHPCRLDRTVQLHLQVAVVSEEIHPLQGILERIGRPARSERAGAVHEARTVSGGANHLPGIDLRRHLHHGIVFATDIAHAGDAAGDIEDTVRQREMAVHVPHTGDQGLAATVNDDCAFDIQGVG